MCRSLDICTAIERDLYEGFADRLWVIRGLMICHLKALGLGSPVVQFQSRLEGLRAGKDKCPSSSRQQVCPAPDFSSVQLLMDWTMAHPRW